MTAIAGWFFDPLPRARVAVLRAFLYGFVWLDLLVLRPWVRDHGDVPGLLYEPLALGRLLPLPTPTEPVVDVVFAALLGCSAVAATGRLPRLAGWAVFALYLQWMVIAFSYGKVDHDRFAFLVALAVLPTVGRARWRDRTRDAQSAWAIRCIQIAVVCTYVLAVLAKHRYGRGLDTWVDSTTLARAVVRRGTFLADPLLGDPWILRASQHLLVAMELSAPVLLLRGRIGRWALSAFAAFHAVTYACLGIAFWPHLACLAAFLPLERLPGWRAATAGEPVVASAGAAITDGARDGPGPAVARSDRSPGRS